MSDSNVDLAELERAFAKDPASDAFLALSRAYLAQNRFMEAMVVCKKGIKNRPDSVDGRLLLAQVYAEQGKLPKALDEVQKLLTEHPDLADAHFFLGQLHERSGRFEEAIEAFKTAFEKDPRHEAAVAALKAKGIEVEIGPSEEELAEQRRQEEERLAAEQAAREAEERAAQEAAQAQQAAVAPPAEFGSAASTFGQTPATGPGTHVDSTVPMAHPATGPAIAAHPASASAYLGGYDPLAAQQERSKRLGFGFTFGLFALLLLAVVSLVVVLKNNKEAKEAIAVHVREATKAASPGTTGGLKKSLEAYKEVLKLDEEHPLATARSAHALALLATERGLRAEYGELAAKTLESAKKFAPDAPETLAAEILLLNKDKKYAEAIALAKDIKAHLVAIAKAKAQVMSGKVDDAKKTLEPLAAAPDPNVHAAAGALWRRLGDRSRASIALNEAIKRSNYHDVARSERALYVLEVKDLDYLGLALDDVTNLLDMGKDNIGAAQRGYALLGRAEIGRINDRENEAERDLNEARRILTSDGQVPFFEANFALADNDQTKAIQLLSTSTENDPNRLLPWIRLIEETGDGRKESASEKAYEDAKKIFGEDLQLELARADALISLRKVNEAHTFLEALVKKQDVAEVHRELGRVLIIKRKTEDALTALKKAAELSTNSSRRVKATVFTLLGRALSRNDQEEDAIGAYKEAIDASRNYAPAYYYLGYSLETQKKTGAAKESYRRAMKIDPTSRVGKKAKARLGSL